MYININLFDWALNNNFYFQGHSFCRPLSISKGYNLIDHAYNILSDDEFALSDVISNLRKAINYRIKDLFKNLGIDFLDLKLGKSKKIEKLEALDIAKPLLVNKLLKIRNDIEYVGANPPNMQECEELIDFVWYFYKSTDRFCTIEPDTLLIEDNDFKYSLSVDFDFHFHKTIRMSGALPESFLGKDKKHENSIYFKDALYNETKNYFSIELDVTDVPYYLDLIYLAILEWGN